MVGAGHIADELSALYQLKVKQTLGVADWQYADYAVWTRLVNNGVFDNIALDKLFE